MGPPSPDRRRPEMRACSRAPRRAAALGSLLACILALGAVPAFASTSTHGAVHHGRKSAKSKKRSRRPACVRSSSRKHHARKCKRPATRHPVPARVPATAPATAPAVTPGQVSTPPPPAESLRLFSGESVFNEQLPGTVPLASDSSQLVSDFLSQVSKYQGHVVINTTSWSSPVYVVGPNQPTIALIGESSICPRPEGVWSAFAEQIAAVPIPPNAIPAAGSDKEIIIWQPATGHLWELWRVLQENGHWTACWGGEITDANTSNGIFPAPFGAGASGLSLLGGQIHLEDLQHASINHALEVLMPDTANGTYVWPADRTDGTSTATDAIPEGTHFRLNPNLNLSTLHLTPAALTIATAIQRYGIIVADTAGDVALTAQDPTPIINEGKPNPYNTLLPNPYTELEAIPWSQLQAVSPSWHG